MHTLPPFPSPKDDTFFALVELTYTTKTPSANKKPR
jgi:hypothetical protein